jgi:hypothetical protein
MTSARRPWLIAVLDNAHARRAMLIILVMVALGLGWSTIYRAAFGRIERTDFTVYTAAGRAVIRGDDIYKAENSRGWLYMYLPVFAIAMVPLATLPVWLSAGIWYLLSLAMLVHILWMAGRLARRYKPAAQWPVFWLGIWALLGIFWPSMSGMARGQASVLLAWFVTLGIYAYTLRRSWLAGAAMAGAIVVKIFPFLFLVYFAFKRQWLMFATTSVSLVLFILIIPSLVFGPRGNYELLHRWVLTIALPANFANEYERDPRYDQLADPRLERNQSVNAVSIRLIAPDKEAADAPARERIAGHVARAMNLFLLLATAHVCRRGRARAEDPETLRQFALVILLMLFISPLSWAHSFTLLALPLAMIAALASLPPPVRFTTLHGAAFIAFVVLVGITGAVKPLQELGALLFCTLGLWLILAWFIDPASGDAQPRLKPSCCFVLEQTTKGTDLLRGTEPAPAVPGLREGPEGQP